MSGKNPLGLSNEPQAYEGVNVIVPVGGWRLVKSNRAPTTNDKKYPIGSIWVNTLTSTSYQLVSAPGVWVNLATTGNLSLTGNLVFSTPGNKIVSSNVGTTAAAGANSFGSVTLTNGTATVSTTSVTASSLIFLSRMTVGTTGANDLGVLSVGTIVAGTSFIINAWTSTNATVLQADDQSNIAYMIVN